MCLHIDKKKMNEQLLIFRFHFALFNERRYWNGILLPFALLIYSLIVVILFPCCESIDYVYVLSSFWLYIAGMRWMLMWKGRQMFSRIRDYCIWHMILLIGLHLKFV